MLLGLYPEGAKKRMGKNLLECLHRDGDQLKTGFWVTHYCGVYRIDMSSSEDLTTMLMHDFLSQLGTQEEVEKICVLSHITEEYPTIYIVTTVDDFLKM